MSEWVEIPLPKKRKLLVKADEILAIVDIPLPIPKEGVTYGYIVAPPTRTVIHLRDKDSGLGIPTPCYQELKDALGIKVIKIEVKKEKEEK